MIVNTVPVVLVFCCQHKHTKGGKWGRNSVSFDFSLSFWPGGIWTSFVISLTGLTQYSYWCLYSNFSSARLSAAYWEAFVCSVFVYKKCFVWVSETYFWEAVSAYSLHFTGTSKHLFNLSSSKDSLLVLNILCYDHPIYSAVSNIEDAYLPNTLLPWGKLFFSPSGCWVKSKSLSPTSGMTQLSTGRMDCCLFMLIINQLVHPCVDLISILNLKKNKKLC